MDEPKVKLLRNTMRRPVEIHLADRVAVLTPNGELEIAEEDLADPGVRPLLLNGVLSCFEAPAKRKPRKRTRKPAQKTKTKAVKTRAPKPRVSKASATKSKPSPKGKARRSPRKANSTAGKTTPNPKTEAAKPASGPAKKRGDRK